MSRWAKISAAFGPDGSGDGRAAGTGDRAETGRDAGNGVRPPEPEFDALARALGARVDGEVRFDAGSRAAYSTDASNFGRVPIGNSAGREAIHLAELLDRAMKGQLRSPGARDLAPGDRPARPSHLVRASILLGAGLSAGLAAAAGRHRGGVRGR